MSLVQCGACGSVADEATEHVCKQLLAHQLKGQYFPVLDEGFVALKDFMGSDEAVVEAARVSYGAGTKKTSDSRQLLRYLFRQRHTTPFEQCVLKFHVKLPIFVARQLIRHRTASVNEYSLRYSLAPLLFYMPEFEVFRKQSATNRQGRGEAADRETYDNIKALWSRCRDADNEAYVEACVEDIAREIARIDLPLSLYTEWYWTINLHNFFNFMRLRADSHAQHEIQVYANMKGAIARTIFPDSFEAFIDYSYAAVTFSRMERLVLEGLLNGAPRGGDAIDNQCFAVGMGKREIVDFRKKLEKPKDPPSFDLDMTTAKTAEYFFERARRAVPDIESIRKARAEGA